jgi:hypothetical protein
MAEETTAIKKADTTGSMIKYAAELKDEVIFRAACNICKSEFRAEAESLYEKTKNISAVHQFLLGKGMHSKYESVRNHLLNHYGIQERNIRTKEYAEDLKEILNQKADRRASLEERKAILNKELLSIAVDTNGLGVEERRRSSETMKKLNDGITEIEDKIAEMDKGLEPVYIVIGKLKDIIALRVKNTTSEEAKKELMAVMDDLSKNIGDLTTGGE